jgi:hypothetical protein
VESQESFSLSPSELNIFPSHGVFLKSANLNQTFRPLTPYSIRVMQMKIKHIFPLSHTRLN